MCTYMSNVDIINRHHRMASAETMSPPDVLPPAASPSTGSSNEATAGSNGSSQSTFDTQPFSSQEQDDPDLAERRKVWGMLTPVGGSVSHGMKGYLLFD